MIPIKRNKLGEKLRKKRKSKRKRIADFADEKMSISTISNIENGSINVSQEMLQYYANKLDFDLNQYILTEEENNTNDYQNEKHKMTLDIVEDLIRANEVDKASEKLRALNLPKSNPLISHVYFFRARILQHRKNNKKAKEYLFKAISSVEQTKSYNTNILSSCYSELSRIFYYENNLPKALEYAEKGIRHFQKDGERDFIIYVLLINQAMYLEQLDQRERASQILKRLWENRYSIENIAVVLNMYDIDAKIKIKSKMYQEAITLVKEGLQIAIQNRSHHRSGELWLTLGEAYHKLNYNDLAIDCILTALELFRKAKKKHLQLEGYRRLGNLYIHQKEWEIAKNTLETGLSHATISSANVIRWCQTLISLGQCYFNLNNLEKAQTIYKEALSLAKRHHLNAQEYNILIGLGEVLEGNNDKEFFDVSKKLFKLAKELRKGGIHFD